MCVLCLRALASHVVLERMDMIVVQPSHSLVMLPQLVLALSDWRASTDGANILSQVGREWDHCARGCCADRRSHMTSLCIHPDAVCTVELINSQFCPWRPAL